MFAWRGQVRLGDFGPKFLGLFLSLWEVKNLYPLCIGLTQANSIHSMYY